jgi:TonB family protein
VPVAPKAPEEAPALVRPGADQPPSQPVDSAAAKASAASQDASGAQAPRQVSPSAPAAPAPQPPAKPPEVAAPASGGAMPRAAASRPESAVADLAPIPLKSDNPHLAARSAGLDAGAHPAREPAQERAADRRPAKRKKAPYLVAAAVVLGALALVGYMAMRPQESDLRPVAHASRPPMEQDETARTEEPGDSENGAPAGTTETPEDGGSAATLARPGSPEPQTVAPAAGLAPPSTGEHRESGGPQASEASHDAAAGTTRDAARPNDGTSRPNGPDGSRARETSPHSAHASPLPSKTPPPAHAAGPARSSTIAGGAEATIGSGAAHISETASAVPASGARPEGGRAARSTPSSSAVTSPGPDGAARGSLLPVSGAHEAELRARKSGSVTSPSAALAPPAAGTRPGAPLVAGAPAAEERSESDARATQAEEAPTGATPPGTSDAVPGVVTSSLTVPPSLAPSNLNSTGLDPFAVDTVPFASPVPIHHPSPPYPPAALSLNQSGTVVLLLKVGADGRVSEVRVTRPAATLLNQAAVRAAYQWTFRPAEQNGRPVTTWVEETVEFKRR